MERGLLEMRTTLAGEKSKILLKKKSFDNKKAKEQAAKDIAETSR